jgi:hypothetical protein
MDFFAGVAGTAARDDLIVAVVRSRDSEDKAALNFFAVEPRTLVFNAEGSSLLDATESGRLGVKGTDRVSLLGAGVDAIVSIYLEVVVVVNKGAKYVFASNMFQPWEWKRVSWSHARWDASHHVTLQILSVHCVVFLPSTSVDRT